MEKDKRSNKSEGKANSSSSVTGSSKSSSRSREKKATSTTIVVIRTPSSLSSSTSSTSSTSSITRPKKCDYMSNLNAVLLCHIQQFNDMKDQFAFERLNRHIHNQRALYVLNLHLRCIHKPLKNQSADDVHLYNQLMAERYHVLRTRRVRSIVMSSDAKPHITLYVMHPHYHQLALEKTQRSTALPTIYQYLSKQHPDHPTLLEAVVKEDHDDTDDDAKGETKLAGQVDVKEEEEDTEGDDADDNDDGANHRLTAGRAVLQAYDNPHARCIVDPTHTPQWVTTMTPKTSTSSNTALELVSIQCDRNVCECLDMIRCLPNARDTVRVLHGPGSICSVAGKLFNRLETLILYRAHSICTRHTSPCPTVRTVLLSPSDVCDVAHAVPFVQIAPNLTSLVFYFVHASAMMCMHKETETMHTGVATTALRTIAPQKIIIYVHHCHACRGRRYAEYSDDESTIPESSASATSYKCECQLGGQSRKSEEHAKSTMMAHIFNKRGPGLIKFQRERQDLIEIRCLWCTSLPIVSTIKKSLSSSSSSWSDLHTSYKSSVANKALIAKYTASDAEDNHDDVADAKQECKRTVRKRTDSPQLQQLPPPPIADRAALAMERAMHMTLHQFIEARRMGDLSHFSTGWSVPFAKVSKSRQILRNDNVTRWTMDVDDRAAPTATTDQLLRTIRVVRTRSTNRMPEGQLLSYRHYFAEHPIVATLLVDIEVSKPSKYIELFGKGPSVTALVLQRLSVTLHKDEVYTDEMRALLSILTDYVVLPHTYDASIRLWLDVECDARDMYTKDSSTCHVMMVVDFHQHPIDPKRIDLTTHELFDAYKRIAHALQNTKKKNTTTTKRRSD